MLLAPTKVLGGLVVWWIYIQMDMENNGKQQLLEMLVIYAFNSKPLKNTFLN